MDELDYRCSRFCRLLGNPVVYQMASYLAERDASTPAELAKATRRSVQTISTHLAKLRSADVVRYETAGGRTRYWLKSPNELRALFRSLKQVVRTTARLPAR